MNKNFKKKYLKVFILMLVVMALSVVSIFTSLSAIASAEWFKHTLDVNIDELGNVEVVSKPYDLELEWFSYYMIRFCDGFDNSNSFEFSQDPKNTAINVLIRPSYGTGIQRYDDLDYNLFSLISNGGEYYDKNLIKRNIQDYFIDGNQYSIQFDLCWYGPPVDYTQERDSHFYTSEVKHIVYHAVEVVELPPDPVKEGFRFVGWYYDEAFTIPYQDGDIITNDTVLYAKFVESKAIIHTFIDGKYFRDELDVPYGAALPTKNELDQSVIWEILDRTTEGRQGRELLGIFYDEYGTNPVVDGDIITDDINLYFITKLKVLEVVFIVDGDIYAVLNIDYGTALVSNQSFMALYEKFKVVSLSSTEIDPIENILKAPIVNNLKLYAAYSEFVQKMVNFATWLEKNYIYLAIGGAIAIIVIVAVILRVKRG